MKWFFCFILIRMNTTNINTTTQQPATIITTTTKYHLCCELKDVIPVNANSKLKWISNQLQSTCAHIRVYINSSYIYLCILHVYYIDFYINIHIFDVCSLLICPIWTLCLVWSTVKSLYVYNYNMYSYYVLSAACHMLHATCPIPHASCRMPSAMTTSGVASSSSFEYQMLRFKANSEKHFTICILSVAFNTFCIVFIVTKANFHSFKFT